MLEGPFLLQGVPFGSGILPMEMLVQNLKLMDTLPTVDMMNSFDFPRALSNPRVGVELNFTVRRQDNASVRQEGQRIVGRLLV